ncbi:hypothetical protein HMI01_14870 [Halolactibacillus miurensis]|uniref:HNH endonuclease n=1 Tax=Halolactibacillus miurensis TaxID=306541 RepID=A0A1I6S103_9BACI|nr:HNH endonuclease [Halolactibacillus miurensis]GEM04499.1 hypothetical protein HMI01_14870 [Halolactibacillus miurensis]SFS70619.1 HNH endonuclease [Halolactibacillus miurensis]
MTFSPYSKQSQLGSKRKKTNRNFSPAVKQAIFERDGYKCVKCGKGIIESVPHHITYKSQGGTGEKRNGVTVCRACHDWSHGLKIGPYHEPAHLGRKWFESWRERRLDQDGNYL